MIFLIVTCTTVSLIQFLDGCGVGCGESKTFFYTFYTVDEPQQAEYTCHLFHGSNTMFCPMQKNEWEEFYACQLPGCIYLKVRMNY